MANDRGSAFGIVIEAVGVPGTDRLVHFSNVPAPSWDSDGAWIHCIPWETYPGQISSSISFFDGTGTIGSMAFEFVASARTPGGVSVESLLTQTTPVKLGALDTQSIAYGDTTIYTDNQLLAGKEVVLKREVLRLGTHTGLGTYTGCVRGRWGTRALNHAFSDDAFISLYDASTGPHLRWRRVQFWRCDLDSATSYADVTFHWTGLINQITCPSPGRVRVDCNALLDMVRNLKCLTDPWQGRAEAQYSEYIQTGVDPAEATDPPEYLFRGYQVRGSKPGQAPAGGSNTLLSLDGKAIAKKRPVLPTNGNTYEVFVEEDDLYVWRDEAGNGRLPAWPEKVKRIWECHHCKGTSLGTYPYSSNLATLFIQLLCTSAEGNNGTYDLAFGDGGLAVPVGFVDTTGIEAIRGHLGELLEQDSLFLNVEKGDGLAVLDWFKGKLWAYGIVVADKEGQIGWSLLTDNDALVTTSISDTNGDICGPESRPPRGEPRWERVMDLGFDSVRAEYAWLPDEGTLSDTIVDAQRRAVNIYGDAAAPKADFGGISDPIKVRLIATSLILLYHEDLARVSLTVKRSVGETFEIGEQIKLTHALVRPRGGGSRGCTDEAIIIERKEDDPSGNVTHITGLMVGQGGSVIAPTLVVDSYTSGATVTIEEDDSGAGYQSGDWSAYPRDVSDIAAGDKLDHCDKRGVVREAALEVLSTTSTTVTFTGTPATPPIAGDLFRVSSYDASATRQQTRYAYLADSSGELGAAPASGKTYTGL